MKIIPALLLFAAFSGVLLNRCSENPQEPSAPQELLIVGRDTLTVPVDYVIRLRFNVELDPATVNSNTFVVRNIIDKDSVVVAGTLTVYDKVNIAFSAKENYHTGSIIKVLLRGIKSKQGAVLQDQELTYLVEGSLYYTRVVGHYPARNATGVGLGDSVVVSFDQDITTAKVALKSNGANLLGLQSISDSIVTFKPLYDFKSDARVVVTISDVLSKSGYPLENDYSFAFNIEHIDYVTVSEVQPANNATDVLSNSNIIVWFDREIASADISVEADNAVVEGVITITGNELVFNPDKYFASDAEVVYTVSNVVATDGNILEQPYSGNFTVEHFDIFPVPKGFFTDPVYVDQQGRIYFGGDSLLRYLPNGKLDKTAAFGSIADIAVTDNGNVYISYDDVVVELDNDLNYLNTYYFNLSVTGRLTAAGNSVYMVTTTNGTSYLSNVITGVSRETGMFMSHGIIFDAENNQLVINGSVSSLLRTEVYTLDLELVWKQSFRIDGFGLPLTYALVQNQAGNYYSFGHFINYGVMRLEYSPTSALVDTVNLGRVNVYDAKPSPIHDVVVVRKDLGFGNRVAVQPEAGWYIAAQGGEVRFYNMNTKAEILNLRRKP